MGERDGRNRLDVAWWAGESVFTGDLDGGIAGCSRNACGCGRLYAPQIPIRDEDGVGVMQLCELCESAVPGSCDHQIRALCGRVHRDWDGGIGWVNSEQDLWGGSDGIELAQKVIG